MRLQELAYARRPRFGHDNHTPNGKDGHLSPSGAPRPQLAAQLVGGLESVRTACSIEEVAPLDMKQVLDFPAPSEAQLRTLLDLTAAEARLAQLLAAGDTLDEVSQKLGIKLTTARSQLAVIFSKTGIRRQTKLVAILSRIAHLE
jgi:DNA-binding CsgD family transcriptional regulator